MAIELKVPEVGESVTEVEIGGWLKSKGDQVEKDEPIVTLESEKATVELPAPSSGSLAQILKEKGQIAKVGEVIAILEANGQVEKRPAQAKKETPPKPEPADKPAETAGSREARVMPAAQRRLEEKGLRPEDVSGSGPGGRSLQEDVLQHGEEAKAAQPYAAQTQAKSQVLRGECQQTASAG